MTEIVVLGGGFAGVFAAKELRKLNSEQFRITLVDKNSYHLFIPSLYEVATAEEPRNNICIPFSEIFPHGVRLIKGEATKINKEKKEIEFKGGQVLTYDYLVVALGSETNYYDIPGLKENSIAFKSLDEGARIRDTIKEKYNEVQKKGQALIVAVVGGGATGVELATELSKMEEHMGGNIEVVLFQGGRSLLKGVSEKTSQIAKERLQKAAVDVHLNSKVVKVSKDYLEIEDGRKHPYDVLIWTGGIRANSISRESGLPLNEDRRIDVDEFLRVKGTDNIFAAGDIADGRIQVAHTMKEQQPVKIWQTFLKGRSSCPTGINF
jgi:NADH:ubiquinone reductase (H+-translocating)